MVLFNIEKRIEVIMHSNNSNKEADEDFFHQYLLEDATDVMAEFEEK